MHRAIPAWLRFWNVGCSRPQLPVVCLFAWPHHFAGIRACAVVCVVVGAAYENSILNPALVRVQKVIRDHDEDKGQDTDEQSDKEADPSVLDGNGGVK